MPAAAGNRGSRAAALDLLRRKNMSNQRPRALEFLKRYEQREPPDRHWIKYWPAICYVVLGDSTEAQRLFAASCAGLLQSQFWLRSAQPYLLVNTCVLSAEEELYPAVSEDVALYKARMESRQSPYALTAFYACGVMELLLSPDADITIHIAELLKWPKVKEVIAMGQALQAIVTHDQPAFDNALSSLLEAHRGMAQHGDLRHSSEGLLCMPAMVLAYIALKHDLQVEVKDDYLSEGYLRYLQESPGS